MNDSVTMMRIADVHPYKRNPRKNDEAVEYVANSIRSFGFRSPIIVDRDHVIIAGHTRYKAAKKLGLKTVPVIVAADLTPEQASAYRLADNKTAEAAQWDKDLLRDELDGLAGLFDMSDFGFEFDQSSEDTEEQDDPGYYGDERERTYDTYNLDQFDESRCAGKYQFPIIEKCDFIPDNLIGFNYAKTNTSKEAGVHFFIDDYQFERIWNAPEDYVELLSEYECMLTPDFSLYMDMPIAMKIWNIYRSRLIGQYMADCGIPVIPTLQWAEPATFDFCFDGIEGGGTVAVSTVGVMRDPDTRAIWSAGMKAAIEKIRPKTILLYGSDKLDFDFGNINVRYYQSRQFKG